MTAIMRHLHALSNLPKHNINISNCNNHLLFVGPLFLVYYNYCSEGESLLHLSALGLAAAPAIRQVWSEKDNVAIIIKYKSCTGQKRGYL